MPSSCPFFRARNLAGSPPHPANTPQTAVLQGFFGACPQWFHFGKTGQTCFPKMPKAAHLAALHLLHQAMQLCAEASGLGFVFMHDGVFKQGIQPLDFLNRSVSLWHRHLYNLLLCYKTPLKPADYVLPHRCTPSLAISMARCRLQKITKISCCFSIITPHSRQTLTSYFNRQTAPN